MCRCLNHCRQPDSTQLRVPAWSPWQHGARPVANHVTYRFTQETDRDACNTHTHTDRQEDVGDFDDKLDAAWRY